MSFGEECILFTITTFLHHKIFQLLLQLVSSCPRVRGDMPTSCQPPTILYRQYQCIDDHSGDVVNVLFYGMTKIMVRAFKNCLRT
jgi:hypothetical protein